MKSLVVFKSAHQGNTEKVARAIAGVLGSEIMEPDSILSYDITCFDLVGFGSGIYFGRFHEEIRSFVEKLPDVDGEKAFIFSTSGLPRIPLLHNYEKPLIRRLESKGFEVVGSFSCRGFDTYGLLKYLGGVHRGRPNREDLEKAKEFAQEIERMLDFK